MEHKVIERIGSDELAAELRTLIHAQTGKGPVGYEVLSFMETQQQLITESLSTITDSEDQAKALACHWLRLHAQWTVLNDQIGYEIVEHGAAKPKTIARAAVIYMLSESLRESIKEEHIQDAASFIGTNWSQ